MLICVCIPHPHHTHKKQITHTRAWKWDNHRPTPRGCTLGSWTTPRMSRWPSSSATCCGRRGCVALCLVGVVGNVLCVCVCVCKMGRTMVDDGRSEPINTTPIPTTCYLPPSISCTALGRGHHDGVQPRETAGGVAAADGGAVGESRGKLGGRALCLSWGKWMMAAPVCGARLDLMEQNEWTR